MIRQTSHIEQLHHGLERAMVDRLEVFIESVKAAMPVCLDVASICIYICINLSTFLHACIYHHVIIGTISFSS